MMPTAAENAICLPWDPSIDLVLPKYSLHEYTSCACSIHFTYFCEFEYMFYCYTLNDLLSGIHPHTRYDQKLVFEYSRTSLDDATQHAIYMVIPLTFIKRTDGSWKIQIKAAQIADVVYSMQNIPISCTMVPLHSNSNKDKALLSLYERARTNLKWIGIDESIRIEGPKQIRRTRKCALSILDKLLPTDVALTIIENVFDKTEK